MIRGSRSLLFSSFMSIQTGHGGEKLHYGGGVYRSLEVYSQLSPWYKRYTPVCLCHFPQMDSWGVKRTSFCWPGDEYVDFIGMIATCLNPATFSNLKTISEYRRKEEALRSDGNRCQGFTDKDYWSKQILTPATGRKKPVWLWCGTSLSEAMNRTCIISVFKGHASEADFIKFHANESWLSSVEDLPDMYQMPENVEVN